MQALTTNEIIPGELRWYYFEFGLQPEIAAGATLTLPVVTVVSSNPPSGMSGPPIFGVPFVAGTQVQVSITGGTPGCVYLLQCLVQTNAGAKMEILGKLYVIDESKL